VFVGLNPGIPPKPAFHHKLYIRPQAIASPRDFSQSFCNFRGAIFSPARPWYRRDKKVSCRAYRLAAFGAFCACAFAAPSEVEVARSRHFEVYSQGAAGDARSILLEFERLRGFFQQQTGLVLDQRFPVRVIAFGSREEYRPYQLRATADAYYVGAPNRDYIVMVTPAPGDFRVPAHEYAHFILHANSIKLPPWLNEGLSEVVATVRRSEDRRRSSGDLQAYTRLLRTRLWMPLAELVSLPPDSPLRERRDTSDLFYAESWALADMLTASPKYSLQFPRLFAALSGGAPSAQSMVATYGQSLEEIAANLRAWVRQRRVEPMLLPPLPPDDLNIQASAVSPFVWRSTLADLLLVTGKFGPAEDRYHALAAEAPQDPEISAALAIIALQKHDWNSARMEWRHALEEGLRNAEVCYEFAIHANQAGFAAEDIRPALERAVATQPDFDDALYMLALMDNNAGRHDAAVAHLQSMKRVAPARNFVYWATLANSLSELGRRGEAIAAASKAAAYATTADERAHAAELEQIARTDVAIQFTRDADGRQRLIATRIPHGTTNWNPFIEPADTIRLAEGTLQAIDCNGGRLRLHVAAVEKLWIIIISDPQRVQVRNSPTELTCGAQPPNRVTVTYAAFPSSDQKADGVARGIEFH
jgi:tetratricopeptide (TPR) repeat protein